MPFELIVKDAANFVHRMLIIHRPVQLYRQLRFPTRTMWVLVPQTNHRHSMERSKRGALNTIINTYATILSVIRGLSKEGFKSVISRHNYHILLPDNQQNLYTRSGPIPHP